MIYIYRNTVNSIYATATENSTIRPLSAITYLCQVSNLETNQEKTFILQNSSLALSRYDLFMLIENQTENLTAGTVCLNSGLYSYKIWEQESNTNLNVDSTGKLLEEGLLHVSGSTQFDYTSQTSTFTLK